MTTGAKASVIRLETKRVEKPWGTRRLGTDFGDVPAGADAIGEIWFEVPASGGIEEPELLVKRLFTDRRLSVQVHPGDHAAKARGFPRGKSEAWYILEAEPFATIAMGVLAPMTDAELRCAAEDGSIVELLDWKAMKPGDFWYAPAGTIHAIGAGLRLIEIQQNVDITYRLYDYGSERPLQLDEAVMAARPVPYVAPFIPYDLEPGRRALAAGGAFVVERWSGARSGKLRSHGKPVWLIPLQGIAVVGPVTTAPGGVWIAVADGDFTLSEACEMLVAYSGGEVDEQLII